MGGAMPTRISTCGSPRPPMSVRTISRLSRNSIDESARRSPCRPSCTPAARWTGLRRIARRPFGCPQRSTVQGLSTNPRRRPTRRSTWLREGKSRATSTRCRSESDASASGGTPSDNAKGDVHHCSSAWYEASSRRSASVSCDASTSCGRTSSESTSSIATLSSTLLRNTGSNDAQYVGRPSGSRSVRRCRIASVRLRWASVTNSSGLNSRDAK